jgi:hypothetical protein
MLSSFVRSFAISPSDFPKLYHSSAPKSVSFPRPKKGNMSPAAFAPLGGSTLCVEDNLFVPLPDVCKKLSKADIALQNRPIPVARVLPFAIFEKVIKSYHPNLVAPF